MPATKKDSLATIQSLGIIAGGGMLPAVLLAACDHRNIIPFVVGFEGQTDPLLVQGRNHLWTRLGAAGQILSVLKSHEIRDLVLIGSIRRPSFSELRPDFRTAEFFARLGLKAIGDNDLLGALRQLLEHEGFRLHGIHAFAQELMTAEGVLGKHKPSKGDWADIQRGIDVALVLGSADVGQAVIVQEGIVLGVEAAEGTDELIRRCKYLKRKGRGGVLVKLCKPQQDRDLDLPLIGPETMRHALDSELAGIAIHAGHSLMIAPEQVAEIADKHRMFVVGVDPSKDGLQT